MTDDEYRKRVAEAKAAWLAKQREVELGAWVVNLDKLRKALDELPLPAVGDLPPGYDFKQP